MNSKAILILNIVLLITVAQQEVVCQSKKSHDADNPFFKKSEPASKEIDILTKKQVKDWLSNRGKERLKIEDVDDRNFIKIFRGRNPLFYSQKRLVKTTYVDEKDWVSRQGLLVMKAFPREVLEYVEGLTVKVPVIIGYIPLAHFRSPLVEKHLKKFIESGKYLGKHKLSYFSKEWVIYALGFFKQKYTLDYFFKLGRKGSIQAIHNFRYYYNFKSVLKKINTLSDISRQKVGLNKTRFKKYRKVIKETKKYVTEVKKGPMKFVQSKLLDKRNNPVSSMETLLFIENSDLKGAIPLLRKYMKKVKKSPISKYHHNGTGLNYFRAARVVRKLGGTLSKKNRHALARMGYPSDKKEARETLIKLGLLRK